MVTPEEAASAEKYRLSTARKFVDVNGKEHTKLPSRSDIAREAVLNFIAIMHKQGQVYRPGKRTQSQEARSVRIAGVFTEDEHQRISEYCNIIGWTFSNVLREALVHHCEH